MPILDEFGCRICWIPGRLLYVFYNMKLSCWSLVHLPKKEGTQVLSALFENPESTGKSKKKHSLNILLMPPPLVRVRSGRLGVVVKAVFPGCNYSRRNTLQSKTAQLLDHWLDRNRRSKFRLAGMAGQMFSAVVLWSGRAGSCRDNQGFRHGRSAGDAQLG